MPTSVTMPQLGESVTEGTVTRWLKQEGDEVAADEPLLEVSTDKVDTEIPAPASGVLQKIMVAEDETVQVGAELAIIGDGGESGAAEQSSQTQSAPAEQPESQEAAPEQQPTDDAAAEQPPPQQAQPESEPAGSQGPQPTRPDQAPAEAFGQDQEQPPAAQASPPQSADGRGGSDTGTRVTMPALGESVTEGTVTRWLKAVGDSVEADEPLLEVSTDKVDTEIPAPTGGTLLTITVNEDETVQVGAELAVIGTAGGSETPPSETPSSETPPSETADPDASAANSQGSDAPASDAPASDAQAPAEPEAAEPAPALREETAAAPDAEAPSESPAGQTEPGSQPSAQQQTQRGPAEPGPSQGEQPPPAAATPGAGPSPDGGAYVTPLVRKLATEHKVDLSSVTGTGVGGRIRKQDVLEAASRGSQPAGTEPATARQPAQPGTTPQQEPASTAVTSDSAGTEPSKRGRTEKLTRLRSLIGKRMIESLQVSAQLTTVVEVDITGVAKLRDRVKHDFLAREGVKLSFLPFFALAAVEALKAHPMVNSSIDSEAGTITYHDSENLGIAVDTERGLLVPVIHNAGDLNLGGMARKISDLAERTRNNKVTPDELGGGTFTLTNTGSRGALFDTPIINQPQVAILGTGTVVKRPVVVDDPNLGEIVTVRSMVYLALTYDHRIVDGADAARFLVTMKERLETGDFESSLGLF
ncbi:MAG: 2-oxoglutarate dehydrogenase, E2 component, dihydrolipoamide succinyltransferase [Geodermatophilaceae bacterium]|nr:2-oxoglutarate dehydrogenase, E2 component, dihydrolipoamide succinyltransferase [Geodermatophilaceae bacterium]